MLSSVQIRRSHASVAAAPTVARPANPVVRATDVSVDLGGRPALNRINVTVNRGESIALLGRNGAGKTTLINVLSTLLAPTSGRLELFSAQRTSPDARRRIGLIGHDLMLYRDLTALENLTLAARLCGLDRPGERALEALDSLGVADHASGSVGGLSRGVAQRTAIARALIHSPDLLLADEPFTGLDRPSIRRLETVLADLRSRGVTIIASDHDAERAMAAATRCLVLRDGRLVLDAPAAVARQDADNAMGDDA